MKVAACQMVSGSDKTANLAEIEKLAAEAAGEGAQLAVFPEFAMFDTPDLTQGFLEAAESIEGEFVTELKRIASAHNLALVAGMHETIPGEDRAYNTLVAVDAAGELVGVYRKQHLYDAFGFKESDYVCPGELGDPTVFEIDGVKVGLLTCYDLRFPEAARQHAAAGVDVLVYPAAWVPGPRKEDHWKTLSRARAIENTIYVVAVTQGPPTVGTGGSLIVDPLGLVLGELGEVNGVVVADVNHKRVRQVRASNPSLSNRRYTISAA